MHPQYRFISLYSTGSVPLHSSNIMSATLSVFSGCSFAQPSGLAPLSLCPKSRNAKGCLLFFSRRFTLQSLHYSSQSFRSILGLAWLFDCRNTANFAPLKIFHKLHIFLAVLGGVIVVVHNSIAVGLSSFFLKTAMENLSKKQLFAMAPFQKNRAHN